MQQCFVFLALGVGLASAHMCMLSPPQRGSMMGINKPEAPDCALLKAPCGDREGKNSMTLKPGQNFTVTFQKNLDHWDEATPGGFLIMFGLDRKMKQIGMVPDKGEPSLTLYSVNVTIPMDMTPMTGYIMQTIYVTKNPKAPANFFQCSDVDLM